MKRSLLLYRLSLLGIKTEALILLIPSLVSLLFFFYQILTKNLDLFDSLIFSLLIALSPYSAFITILERRKFRFEKEFSDFLFELSELVRGGIDPMRAIKVLSERNLGSITKFVRIVAKQIDFGFSFEKAMRNLAFLLKSSLVANYAELVIQASYTGGSISSLIQKASSDMKTIIAIEEEKRAGLRQYLMIFYFAQIILLALSIIVVTQFLPGLSEIGSFGLYASGIISQADLDFKKISESLYHLVIINSVFGGLIIGKISAGSIKQGLKHSLILVIVSYVAWNSFTATAGQEIELEIVSKPESLYIGLPSEEIVVKIKDIKGEPVKDRLVVFKVNKGKAIPETALTNSSGMCAVRVVAEGEEEGFFEIIISSGKASKRLVLPGFIFSQ